MTRRARRAALPTVILEPDLPGGADRKSLEPGPGGIDGDQPRHEHQRVGLLLVGAVDTSKDRPLALRVEHPRAGSARSMTVVCTMGPYPQHLR